jgi:hypothetical protein
VRLHVPGGRMANGSALGKFAQGTPIYVEKLQSSLFLPAYFAYAASHVRLWPKTSFRCNAGCSRLRTEADMSGQAKPAGSVEIDPSETLRVATAMDLRRAALLVELNS